MHNITKRYPGVVALDNVSVELHAGEVLCLVGENGAGKSTLMKILSGALTKDSGDVLIEGRDIQLRSPAEARNLGIGMIYQDLKLVPELTVAENIVLGHEPRRGFFRLIDQSQMKRAAVQALEQLGEDINPSAQVKELSIAQQQLVAIARAIAQQVRILVLDEPTAPLTTKEIEKLFTVLRALKSSGVGIVYISHRLEEISEIADRITVLRDGKVVRTTPASSLDRPSLIRLMVGREMENEFPLIERKPGNVVLEVRGLLTPKLNNISMSVRRGEVVGLAGLVGAGRTELARAIFGADPIISGEVLLDGTRIHPSSPREAIDLGIGLLTEDRNQLGLIMEMNIRENISLSFLQSMMRGLFVDSGKELDRTGKISKKLRVKTPSIDQKVTALSGGNRQKVVLARWLLGNMKVLTFDEPTNGIDVGVRYEIYQIINQLAVDGLGIIVISSDLPELLGICDRIFVMREGHITGEVSRGEATQEKIMSLATSSIKERYDVA